MFIFFVVTLIILIIILFAVIKKKRKFLIITLAIYIMLIILYFLFLTHTYSYFFNKGKTIEEILNIDLDKIEYIKLGVPENYNEGPKKYYEEDYDLIQFKNEFENKKLKINRDVEDIIGDKLNLTHKLSTTREYRYVCFDKDNTPLFTIWVFYNNTYGIKLNEANKEDINQYYYQ